MHHPVIHFICFLFSTQLALSAPVQLQNVVQQPPRPELLKDPQTTAFKLKILLDAGKLEEFYLAANQEFKQLDDEYGKKLDKERFQERLWLFYYIAAIPLFSMDDNPDEIFPWFHSRYLDYLTKFSALRYMVHPNTTTTDKETKLAVALTASYCAQIIKDMRRSYNPELAKQQPRDEEKFLEHNRKLIASGKLTHEQFTRREKLFQYRMSTMERRNDTARNNLNLMEKDFINMLTRYFSDNAGKAKQLIKQAGYTDKEIPDLLNRTVGRNAKTEFLYKGTGKRHKSS